MAAAGQQLRLLRMGNQVGAQNTFCSKVARSYRAAVRTPTSSERNVRRAPGIGSAATQLLNSMWRPRDGCCSVLIRVLAAQHHVCWRVAKPEQSCEPARRPRRPVPWASLRVLRCFFHRCRRDFAGNGCATNNAMLVAAVVHRIMLRGAIVPHCYIAFLPAPAHCVFERRDMRLK